MAAPSPTPSRGLTPKFIESLAPGAKDLEIPDRRAPGLCLRVLPSGRRVFRWYCTARRRVFTIGPWSAGGQLGHVTLAQAREWLERLKAAHDAGDDELARVESELRVHLRERARVADPVPENPNRRTFKSVAEEFYTDDIVRNRKHPDDVRAMLDQDLLPSLGHMPLDGIATLDCRDAIKRVVTGRGRPSGRAAPVHAGKVLSTLKQLFNWAQSNGFTDRNPAFPLKGRHIGVEVNATDRWLDDKEIPIFWAGLEAAVAADRPDAQKIRPATAAALKLLLLTAVRTNELLRARWEDVDLEAGTWTIPVANQKLTKAQERKAKPFVIALPPTAVSLFEALQELAGESPWVMASGEAEGGHYTEKSLGRAMRRLQVGKEPVLKLPGGLASPHDLRRTARTHLAKLRVPHWIVERVLNHSLGKIAATYDQHDYLDERREALEKWNAYVAGLLNPGLAKVVPLPAAGA